MPQTKSINIAGVRVDLVRFADTLELIHHYLASGRPHQIVTVNPEFVMRAQVDAKFRRILASADLALADGAGLLWASRLLVNRGQLPTSLPERIAGSDLVAALLKLGEKNEKLTFYLLGGSTTSAERVQSLYPNVRILGARQGPRLTNEGRPADDAATRELSALLADITTKRPAILLVGFGAPKQEFFIDRYKKELGIPVMIGVGGTFEYLAGELPRAPKWLQRIHLEWLWRLVLEPRRLSRAGTAVVRFPLLVLMTKQRNSE